MENTHLINRHYHKLTVPELWYLEVHKVDASISLFFTKKCWEIYKKLLDEKEIVVDNHPSTTDFWGIKKILPPVIQQGEKYLYILTHKPN